MFPTVSFAIAPVGGASTPGEYVYFRYLMKYPPKSTNNQYDSKI